MEWLKKNKVLRPLWLLGSKISHLRRIFYSPYVTNKIFVSTTAIVAVLLLVILEFFINPIEETVPQATALINGHVITLEIANTPAKQNQGLSNRLSLPANHGMLFIFDDYRQRTFWMKDMQFNIDIIWIKDNIVIDLIKNVPIPTTTPLLIYTSPNNINIVLELSSGSVEKYDIKPGDKVIHN